jgi:hypothetical protein
MSIEGGPSSHESKFATQKVTPELRAQLKAQTLPDAASSSEGLEDFAKSQKVLLDEHSRALESAIRAKDPAALQELTQSRPIMVDGTPKAQEIEQELKTKYLVDLPPGVIIAAYKELKPNELVRDPVTSDKLAEMQKDILGIKSLMADAGILRRAEAQAAQEIERLVMVEEDLEPEAFVWLSKINLAAKNIDELFETPTEPAQEAPSQAQKDLLHQMPDEVARVWRNIPEFVSSLSVSNDPARNADALRSAHQQIFWELEPWFKAVGKKAGRARAYAEKYWSLVTKAQ